MRRLPGWVIIGLAALTILMLLVGWVERDHVGPVPMILGVVWALFTLASAAAMFRPESD
jgi:hypothetical protein